MNNVRSLLQLIAVCGLGAFSGVLVMVLLTLVPYWRNLHAEAFLVQFALLDSHVIRTVGVVLLPALISLVASLWLGWATPGRWLWVAATSCIVVLLIMTAIYFLPQNSVFAAGTLPLSEVGPALNRWANLHILRVVLALGATVCAAQAFRL